MKSLHDALQEHTNDDFLEKGEQLVAIQEVLNDKYPGRTRAKKLNDGALTITTPSSTIANDLRLSQVKLQKELEKYGVETIKIHINQ